MTATVPDSAIVAALRRLRLVGADDRTAMQPLSGGVSSDIWKVTTADGRMFCVKRALPKLKVAQDWRAPVERSRYEYDWLDEAGRIVPEAVPKLLGYDFEAGLFALEWLPPERYRWWKGELRDGRVDPSHAAAVGAALVRIHAGTAGRTEIARRFPTDAIFYAIRLEPYLVATARCHPDLAARLATLVQITQTTKRALVHGDVSPKNILIGPDGPTFLDAECAWWGDPAFDLAFCLNHMLLKGLWNLAARGDLRAAFQMMATEYLAGVDWEPRADIERRVAHLLPGLLLARVDGKSPVEYLSGDTDKSLVRAVARRFLMEPADHLMTIASAWQDATR